MGLRELPHSSNISRISMVDTKVSIYEIISDGKKRVRILRKKIEIEIYSNGIRWCIVHLLNKRCDCKETRQSLSAHQR
jgi:hypothetical protein